MHEEHDFVLFQQLVAALEQLCFADGDGRYMPGTFSPVFFSFHFLLFENYGIISENSSEAEATNQTPMKALPWRM